MGPHTHPGCAPGHFTENLGQLGEGAGRFHWQSPSLSVALGTGWVAYTLREGGSGDLFRILFEGADTVEPEGRDPLGHPTSYFVGSDPDGWVRGARSYREVVYHALWPGIDLVYRFEGASIKYELLVKPGAETGDIVFRVEGHAELDVDEKGDLAVHGSATTLRDEGLLAFYRGDPEEKVPCRFRIVSHDLYGFSLGEHDGSRPVVIDPMVWGSFLGGTGTDYVYDIAVDGEGASYVTGYSYSEDFPTTPGALPPPEPVPATHTFVTKISADGSEILYSVIVGGMSSNGNGIAVDAEGCAFLAGIVEGGFLPTTAGSIQPDYGGGAWDGFLLKLSADGSGLEFCTYIGGWGQDSARSVALDGEGNAYVCGSTQSSNFPTSSTAYSRQIAGISDGYVMKVSGDGSHRIFSTLVGGKNRDEFSDIAVGLDGMAYATGETQSPDFPVTVESPLRPGIDGIDVCVVKVGEDGSNVEYSMLVGGSSGHDIGHSIAVDAAGSAYVTGRTSSTDLPVTSGAFQTEHRDDQYDAFVARIPGDGSGLVFITYLGSSDYDVGLAIAVDDSGFSYVTGHARWRDFPTTSGAFQEVPLGNESYSNGGFLTRLSPDGTWLAYSSFVDGGTHENCNGIALDHELNVYIGGETTSVDLPVTAGSFMPEKPGDPEPDHVIMDGFVVKLGVVSGVNPPVADAGEPFQVGLGGAAEFDGTGSKDDKGIANYTWILDVDGEKVRLFGPEPSYTFESPGTYLATLFVIDTEGNWDSDSVRVEVVELTPPTADAGPDQVVDEDTPVTLDGTGSTDDVGLTRLEWTFVAADGVERTLEGATPSHTFVTPGEYRVTLTVTDTDHLTDTDTVTVVVVDVTPPVAYAGPDTSVETGSPTTLDGSASRDNVGVVNWTWSVDDEDGQLVLFGPRVEAVLGEVGDHLVTLRVRDAAGNRAEDTKVVVVWKDEPPVVDPRAPVADAGDDQRVPLGETVSLDGRGSSDDEGILEWNWTLRVGKAELHYSGPVYNITFGLSGTYEVTLTVRDANGLDDTDVMKVTVYDRVVAGEDHSYIWIIVAMMLLSLIYNRVTRKRTGDASTGV